MKPEGKKVLIAALLVLSAFLLIGILLMPLPLHGLFSPPPTEPPLLTPEEEKQAIDITLNDPNVQKLLEGREYNVSGIFSMFIAPAPGYGVDDVDSGCAPKRYALVTIDILDEYANMSACMTVDVNLNESIVEYVSFEMSRSSGVMMSLSMLVMTMMIGDVHIHDIHESGDVSGI